MKQFLFGLALVAFVVGCGKDDSEVRKTPAEPKADPKPKPEPKADVTMPLDVFLEEHRKDEKGARAKYVGKEMEFAATVFGVSDVDPFYVLMVDYGKEPKSGMYVAGQFRLDSDASGKEKELRLLSAGQKVTIRARGTDEPRQFGLDNIRIVDSGPSPARVATVSELVKIEKDIPEREKLRRKEVLVRVKIAELRPSSDNFYVGTVTDPDSPSTKPVLLGRPFHGAFRKEFEALKVGDVVTILAGLDAVEMPLAFYGARIVKEAPAGLKMPGEK